MSFSSFSHSWIIFEFNMNGKNWTKNIEKSNTYHFIHSLIWILDSFFAFPIHPTYFDFHFFFSYGWTTILNEGRKNHPQHYTIPFITFSFSNILKSTLTYPRGKHFPSTLCVWCVYERRKKIWLKKIKKEKHFFLCEGVIL